MPGDCMTKFESKSCRVQLTGWPSNLLGDGEAEGKQRSGGVEVQTSGDADGLCLCLCLCLCLQSKSKSEMGTTLANLSSCK